MAQLSTSLPGTSQQPTLPAAQPVSTLDTEAKRRLEGMRQAAGTHEAARHRLAVRLGLGLNGSFFYPSDDRTILECQIIPYYQLAADFRRILFIGTDWYTHGYNRLFRMKDFTTIDPDPAKAQYGARQHIRAPMQSIPEHFAAGSLDLVLCNGVVGWGLNQADQAEVAFRACFDALRPGGHLIIGWNDLPAHRPFRLSEIRSLAPFAPLTFGPLKTAERRVDNEWRHTFSFFAKPL